MNLILTSAALSYATFSLNKDVNLYVSLSLICPTLSLLLPQPSSPEPRFPACVRQFSESCFYCPRSKTGNRN